MKKADNQNASLDDEGYDAPDHSYSANPEEQAMQRDKVERVRMLINQLPEKQRTCMQLRDVEGKPYKEIASILNMTEQQVKINIFRARQTIKEEYLKQEKYGL
jgi:RNA polymerase sigma-70 factor (ECF subfamily)